MKSSPTRRFFLTALTALAAVFSFAVQATPETAFEDATRLFTAALGGETAAVDKAADAFDTLLKAEPANPLLMAYAGASTAMKARTTVLPWKKMGFAEDGLAQLDKALALLGPAHETQTVRGVPLALEARYVAANTFLAVPGFMNRGARGAKLLADVQSAPGFAGAPLGFRGQVLMRAALLAQAEKRNDDARKLLETVVAANAPQSDAAKAQLKALQ